jgi:hypothetical protein
MGARVLTERSPGYCWYILAVATAAAAAATAAAWEFQPIRRPVIFAVGIWPCVVIFIRIVTRPGARPRRGGSAAEVPGRGDL